MSDEPGEKRSEKITPNGRDGITVMCIGASFIAMLIISTLVGSATRENSELGQAMFVMTVIGLTGLIVFGIWGLIILARD